MTDKPGDLVRDREDREALDAAIAEARGTRYEKGKAKGVIGITAADILDEAMPAMRAQFMLRPRMVDAAIRAYGMRRIRPIMGNVKTSEVTTSPFLAGLDLPLWVSVPHADDPIDGDDDDEEEAKPGRRSPLWVHINDLTGPMIHRFVAHRKADIDGRTSKLAPFLTMQREFDLWREPFAADRKDKVTVADMVRAGIKAPVAIFG